MSTNNLKGRAASAVLWTALQKYSVMAVTFVSDILLARLLQPFDFGCIEMLAIFILLSEVVVNGGFGSALIQKKMPTQDDYSTIFFWNLGVAFFLYSLLFVSAPAIAKFYRIAELSKILRWQSLILFVYVFNVIQINILKKQLRFKAISLVTMLASFVSLTITIVLAYLGFGVWALVVRNLVSATIVASVLWFYVRWRPSLTFSVKSFKNLFGFGFYIFLSNILTTFAAKFQSFLIGRVYNPVTMGYYSKASGTERNAATVISQVLDQVTFPLYSKTQDDKAALQNMLMRTTTLLAYLTFPLMFLLIVVAKPLFIILYSERWLPSVPYFQLLCLAGIASCLHSANFQTISAIGKSKITFKWTMIKQAVGIVVIVGGLAICGINGILVGFIVSAWFSYAVSMGLSSKYIGYKWFRQLQNLLPLLILSVFCASVSYFISWSHLGLYADFFVKILTFVVLYIGISFLLKLDAFQYFITLISSLKMVKGKRI